MALRPLKTNYLLIPIRDVRLDHEPIDIAVIIGIAAGHGSLTPKSPAAARPAGR